MEAKTKLVPELLVLKTELKSCFGICMLRQRMLVDNSIASYAKHVLRNGSQDGDDQIPLISFVYHCKSFLISHRQSVKEGLLVVIIFCELGALMPVPPRIGVRRLDMQSRNKTCLT